MSLQQVLGFLCATICSSNMSNSSFMHGSSEKLDSSDNSQLLERRRLEQEIWNEINQDYEKNKADIEDYIKSKFNECDADPSPTVKYLDEHLLPLLKSGLYEMLFKVEKDNSFYRPKTSFDGLDFLSEYLYNKNPLHPQRQTSWTYIFDTDWVIAYLKQNPRPFYPFHRIWSKNYAALKIQSFIRGYRDRRLQEVQEVRTFWKNIGDDGHLVSSPKTRVSLRDSY